MGICHDSVQFEAWAQEVWKQGTDGGFEGADAIACHGHLDTDACRQAITRTADAGAVVTVVSKGVKDRRHKGACLHKWSIAKELNSKAISVGAKGSLLINYQCWF